MSSKYKIHSTKYNFLMNIILKMSSFIFPMITFPYISRVLLATGNGKVAFATSVINYFVLIATLGIPTYGVKACAEIRDDNEQLNKTVHELLFINIICMCISYILFVILMFLVPEFQEDRILLWITSISIFLGSLGVEWFYQAIEQYDYITFRNIAFKIISIILMFAFVHTKEDFIIYGAINVIGTYGSNILNIIRLPRYISFHRYNNYNIRKHLQPIIMLFLYSAATTIYTNLDVVMLGFMSGDIQVGYYNAAVKLKNVLVSIVTALGSVVMPRVAYYLKNKLQIEFQNIIKKSFSFIFLISMPLAIYFTSESDAIINFLAGEGYNNAILTMQIITPSIVFIGISSITAWQLLIPLGNNKYTVIGAILGAIIDLILNSLLIPYMGSAGAAIGTLVAEITVVIVHFKVLYKIVKPCIINKNIIKILLSSIIAYLPYMLISSLEYQLIILRLIYTSIAYFGIYLLLLLIFKEKIVVENVNNIKTLMIKKHKS